MLAIMSIHSTNSDLNCTVASSAASHPGPNHHSVTPTLAPAPLAPQKLLI